MHGSNRNECLMRLRRALDEMVVGGIETTIPLFQELVREPDILDGDYNIHWLEHWLAKHGALAQRASCTAAFRLTPEILLGAYAEGLFPMAERRDDPNLYWISPEPRGIIPLDGFHVPQAAGPHRPKRRFAVTIDTAFDAVIGPAPHPRPGGTKPGSTTKSSALYTALHARGHAHASNAGARASWWAGFTA